MVDRSDEAFSPEKFKGIAGEGDVSAYVDAAVLATAQLITASQADAAEMVLSLLQLHDDLLYDVEVECLRAHDLSVASFHILFIVALAESIDSRDVTRISRKSRAALSAIVKTLEAKGLITKTQGAEDKRKLRLAITASGQATFQAAWAVVHRREVAWATQLEAAERAELTRLLRKLYANPPAGIHRRS